MFLPCSIKNAVAHLLTPYFLLFSHLVVEIHSPPFTLAPNIWAFRHNSRLRAQRARRGILMPRGKHCREKLLPLNCCAITLTTGAILKEEKMSSIVGERQFRRHFKRQFGRGQSRVKNCRETVGGQFLPRGIKISRRALWERATEFNT